MVYAYDLWAQLPVKDLYDSLMMATAIAAAKDRYYKSYEQMKDFGEKYGDFMSPFAKDMDLYGKMVGGVHDLVDNALANGVDLYKSPEGRALIGRAINMVDPGLFNRMRANAKAGYAYLDAMQALKKAGKYSQEQEDFDIEKSKGTPFDLFSSLSGKMWDRTSPIERTDLGDLTRKYYEKRTPRLLSQEDFNDPRLAGKYKYDPRYNWYGYLDSDLMKVSPGASAGLIGDPRADFFRDQAEKKVVARGELPTAEAVEALFLRDIADANSWALVDPDKKVDEYEKMRIENQNKWALLKDAQSHAEKMAGVNTDLLSQWSFRELVKRNTATAIAGLQALEYSKDVVKSIKKQQDSISVDLNKRRSLEDVVSGCKSAYGKNIYSENDIADFLGYPMYNENTKTMILPKNQIRRLYSEEDVSTRTYGVNYPRVNTDRNWLKDAKYVLITPTQGSYGAYMDDNRFKNYFEFEVQIAEEVPVTTESGQYIGRDGKIIKNGEGVPMTEIKPVGESKTMYLDSNITSIQNVSKDGVDTPVVDTDDSRFASAMSGDVRVSRNMLKGSDYGFDASYTEEPWYGVIPKVTPKKP